jgi:hypothetical protein
MAKCYCTMPVVKTAITALKNVLEPEINPTIPVHEENGKSKCGALKELVDAGSSGWSPAPLWYNHISRCPDVIVQRQWRIMGRDL